MTPEECKQLEPYFDASEILATGAKLEDVNLRLMLALRDFRKAIDLPVWLLPNGLTTGDHSKDSYHFKPEGAVDFYISLPHKSDKVVEELLNAGFRGIGVYWNGAIRSYHADRRPKFTFWRGTKRANSEPWTYDDLIKIPWEGK